MAANNISNILASADISMYLSTLLLSTKGTYEIYDKKIFHESFKGHAN